MSGSCRSRSSREGGRQADRQTDGQTRVLSVTSGRQLCASSPVKPSSSRKAEVACSAPEKFVRVSLSMAGGSVSECKEYLFKVLVIGELGVGKTSIIKRYVHQLFSQHYRATIGVDFALKVINWDSKTLVRLQLWDIAGKRRLNPVTWLARTRSLAGSTNRSRHFVNF